MATYVVPVPSKPHQPVNFKFPKRSLGKKKPVYRSFQSSWFRQWPFLHYDEANDLAFCHTCLLGFEQKKNEDCKRRCCLHKFKVTSHLCWLHFWLRYLLLIPKPYCESYNKFSCFVIRVLTCSQVYELYGNKWALTGCLWYTFIKIGNFCPYYMLWKKFFASLVEYL